MTEETSTAVEEKPKVVEASASEEKGAADSKNEVMAEGGNNDPSTETKEKGKGDDSTTKKVDGEEKGEKKKAGKGKGKDGSEKPRGKGRKVHYVPYYQASGGRGKVNYSDQGSRASGQSNQQDYGRSEGAGNFRGKGKRGSQNRKGTQRNQRQQGSGPSSSRSSQQSSNTTVNQSQTTTVPPQNQGDGKQQIFSAADLRMVSAGAFVPSMQPQYQQQASFTPPEVTGSGCIPVAVFNHQVMFLLYNPTRGKKKKWLSDFGGKLIGGNRDEKEETIVCAARELYEESYGVFGSEVDLDSTVDSVDNKKDSAIDNVIKTIQTGVILPQIQHPTGYVSFFVPVQYVRADLLTAMSQRLEAGKRVFCWVPAQAILNHVLPLHPRLRAPHLNYIINYVIDTMAVVASTQLLPVSSHFVPLAPVIPSIEDGSSSQIKEKESLDKKVPKKLGILLCQSGELWAKETVSRWTSVFSLKDEDVEVFHAYESKLPSNVGNYQGFVITDSLASVDDALPWFPDLYSFIQKISASPSLRLFGSCFGAQAITAALGGTVTYGGKGSDVVLKSERLQLGKKLRDQPFTYSTVSDPSTSSVQYSSYENLLHTRTNVCVTPPSNSDVLASCSSPQNKSATLPLSTPTNPIGVVYITGKNRNIMALQGHSEYSSFSELIEHFLPCIKEAGGAVSDKNLEEAKAAPCDPSSAAQLLKLIKSFLLFDEVSLLAVMNDPQAVKECIRRSVWDIMESRDLALSPRPCHHHIPSFLGADRAAANLVRHKQFMTAHVIKVNPSSSQKSLRSLILKSGKTLVVPSCSLSSTPFYKLDPIRQNLTMSDIEELTNHGELAEKKGDAVSLKTPLSVDLVVIGSTVVSPDGFRLGRGKGCTDLEYIILRKMGAVNEKTLVVTTVSDAQVVYDIPTHLVCQPWDVPVDIIVTPTQIIYTNTKLTKPSEVVWSAITDEMMAQMPILKELREMGGTQTDTKDVKEEVEVSENKEKTTS